MEWTCLSEMIWHQEVKPLPEGTLLKKVNPLHTK
jgi:hypothetical protein